MHCTPYFNDVELAVLQPQRSSTQGGQHLCKVYKLYILISLILMLLADQFIDKANPIYKHSDSNFDHLTHWLILHENATNVAGFPIAGFLPTTVPETSDLISFKPK